MTDAVVQVLAAEVWHNKPVATGTIQLLAAELWSSADPVFAQVEILAAEIWMTDAVDVLEGLLSLRMSSGLGDLAGQAAPPHGGGFGLNPL